MKIENKIAPSSITVMALNAAIAEVCSHITEKEFMPQLVFLSTPNYYAEVRLFCYDYDRFITPIIINTSEKGKKWGVRVVNQSDESFEIWIDTEFSTKRKYKTDE